MSYRRARVISFVGSLCLCAACAGLKFTPSPINVAMPPDMVARTTLSNFATYPSNLGGLAGHILYLRKVDGACPNPLPTEYSSLAISVGTYVKNGEELKPTPSPTPRYESKIDRSASASATVTAAVASIAGGLSSEQAADIVVSEVYLQVRDDQVDMVRLAQVANSQLPANVCERLFIRGAALTTNIYKQYIAVSANGTTSGAAFGVNGKVFASTTQYAQAFSIGLELQHLTDVGNPQLIASHAPPIPRSLRVPEGGMPTEP